jgi:Lon protease-like protein
MFPLSTVLFPHAELMLHVFEPRYRELTERCLAGDHEFGVVLIARGSEVGGGDERFDVGTVARIEAATRFDDGRFAVAARGTRRIAVRRWLGDDPFPLAEVEDLPGWPATGDDTPLGDGVVDGSRLDAAAAAVRRARTLLSEMGSAAPVVSEPADSSDEEKLWRLCARAPVTPLDHQRLLVTDGPVERTELLTELCGAVALDLVRLLGGAMGNGGR